MVMFSVLKLQRSFIIQKGAKLPNTRNLNSFSGAQELRPIAEVRVEKQQFTLLKALHKVFWVEFYSVGILKFIADLAGFGGPMLLNR